MEARGDLVEGLRQLVRAPEAMLSRVFIDREGRSQRFLVKGGQGETLMVINEEDLVDTGSSVAEFLERTLDSLVCECGVVLLDGEVGLCGGCEARIVMDLLRMTDLLA